jgi:hypothetical protein
MCGPSPGGLRRNRTAVALALAACCGACMVETRRLPAHGVVEGTRVETTVDSELARYLLGRRVPGAAVDPQLEARVDEARATVHGAGVREALTRISQESPDLATLLLAEALATEEGSARLRRLYAQELEVVEEGSGRSLDASGYTLLFAPGWLYRSHAENGAGFERQLAVAARMGIEAERIETDENASVEHNAGAIAHELRLRRSTGRRYVLVSASKSGPEVALALAMLSAEEAEPVAAWINVAGVIGGSPLADAALVAPRCWGALALFGWRRWGLEGMRSMSTRVRRRGLGELRIPEHVLVVNDLPLPLSGQVSARARQGYQDMRSLGPNDGLALTLDEVFPGGETLVELGLDHYLAAPDIDRRTEALTRAVLRRVQERGREGPWPAHELPGRGGVTRSTVPP